MAIDSYLTDSKTGRSATVLSNGSLAVAPVQSSTTYNAELITDDVVVNVVPARANHIFCLTGIFLTGNEKVETTVPATVTIFTGDSETTIAADAITTLLTIPVFKESTRDINPILVEAEEGKWINGVTTDDDISITIFGYYLLNEAL